MNIYYCNWLKRLLALLLVTGVFLCFSFNGYAQENGNESDQEEEEEGPELTREAQVALVAAQDLLKQEDYAGAGQILQDFLATEPEVVPQVLYLMLGQCWYAEENFEEARKVWKAGHEAYPESDDLFRYYAVTTYYTEKFVEAGKLFEEYYDFMEEKDISFLNNAAAAFYTGEDLDDAKRIFKRMINMPGDPDPQWLETVISICFEQEKLDETEENILVALDYYPANETYWDYLYRIRMAKEDYLGGTSALEIKYHINDPEDKDSWRMLTDLYAYLNVPLRAAKDLPKSFDENAGDKEYIKVAENYADAQRVDEAVAYLDGLISKKPSSTLMLEKGQLLFNARRNEEAIKALDECIEFAPETGYAYMLKGFAAWDLMDWDTAREAFKGALGIPDYKAQAKSAMSFMDDLEDAKTD